METSFQKLYKFIVSKWFEIKLAVQDSSGLQEEKGRRGEKSLKDICGWKRCWKQKLRIYLFLSPWILNKKKMWQDSFHSFFFVNGFYWKLSSSTLRFENENYLQNISTSLSIFLSFSSILSFEYKFQFFFSLLIFVCNTFWSEVWGMLESMESRKWLFAYILGWEDLNNIFESCGKTWLDKWKIKKNK